MSISVQECRYTEYDGTRLLNGKHIACMDVYDRLRLGADGIKTDVKWLSKIFVPTL